VSKCAAERRPASSSKVLAPFHLGCSLLIFQVAPFGGVSDLSHRNVILFTALRPYGGESRVDKSKAYRQFAAQCLEMARAMDSQHDRAVLLDMALLWSRLAELAMQSTALKEDVDS
jgi:hypothetical protein